MSSGLIVINLDRSTERLKRVRTQLEAHQLDFHRLAATDARSLGADERDRYYSPALNRLRYHKTLVPGEIACYISHIRAWQHLLASDWTHAVILEDDVELMPHFRTAIEAIAQIPGEWDIIKLGARRRKRLIPRFSLPDGLEVGAYPKVPACAHAQAISRRGAEKLLAHAMPFGRPVDVDIQHTWEGGLTVYGLMPYCANPSASAESEIWKFSTRKIPRNRIRFYRNRLQFTWRAWCDNVRRHGSASTLAAMLLPPKKSP